MCVCCLLSCARMSVCCDHAINATHLGRVRVPVWRWPRGPAPDMTELFSSCAYFNLGISSGWYHYPARRRRARVCVCVSVRPIVIYEMLSECNVLGARTLSLWRRLRVHPLPYG